MIDEATGERLRALVRRESRSLLQYLREVPPWSGAADKHTVERLRSLAQAEQAATDALGKYLQKRRAGLSHLGPYPAVFTDVNDAALSHLLPKVVREQKEAATALEADAAMVSDADARTLVDRLVHLGCPCRGVCLHGLPAAVGEGARLMARTARGRAKNSGVF